MPTFQTPKGHHPHMKRSINPLFIILGIIVASSLWLYFLMWISASGKNKQLDASAPFNNTDIKGILKTKRFRSGIEIIEVNNHPQHFTFRPKINAEGNFFHAQTSIGDSIIKPAFSPVLTVVSGQQKHRYFFE
jgi:hypothetical protein